RRTAAPPGGGLPAGARDRSGGPHGAAGRPGRPGRAGRGPGRDPAPAGGSRPAAHGRGPGALRRPRPRGGRRALGGVRAGGGPDPRGRRVPGGLLRFRPRLRLPHGAAGPLRHPAPGDTAHGGPGGFGRAGRALHGGVPEDVAGRLAADRDDGRGAVGPRAGTRGAPRAGHPGAFRAGRRPGAGDSGGGGGHRERGGGGMTDRALAVVRAGALTTVQDQGRAGHAHLGVPRSGALDGPAAALVNRLVGNAPDAAVLETTVDGCALRPRSAVTVAVAGAPCAVTVDGRPAAWGAPVRVRAGEVLEAGRACCGVRAYVGVSGGIAVDPVLGSRSTDLLSGLGPAPLTDGAVLPLGAPAAPPARVDVAPVPAPPLELVLRVTPGPRDDWFT